MKLFPAQLAQLRQDLTILAVIRYETIMDELLDHYASLTEQKMNSGMSFDEASRWAWAELGSGSGIQQIQTDFEASIHRRHVAIMRSYFGWPTILTTVLLATLVYLIVPLVSAMVMSSLLWTFWLILILIFGYSYKKQKRSRPDQWEIFQTYLTSSNKVILYAIILGNWLLDTFTHKSTEIWLFQLHSTIGAVLCCLSLIYAISFLQPFKETFSIRLPKLAIR